MAGAILKFQRGLRSGFWKDGRNGIGKIAITESVVIKFNSFNGVSVSSEQ